MMFGNFDLTKIDMGSMKALSIDHTETFSTNEEKSTLKGSMQNLVYPDPTL